MLQFVTVIIYSFQLPKDSVQVPGHQQKKNIKKNTDLDFDLS